MDGISSLPDDIVCHILSFLPTKEAALTSVLSKRWRINNLYALTPNLQLDDFDYRNDPNNYTSFIDFVDKVFAVSGNSPIKKFALKHRQRLAAVRINGWICNVLSRGVLDLNLFLTCKNKYSLPLEVFSCNTIVNLKLGMGFSIDLVPENASLPALKTLFLNCIGNFEALVSACHVLEELTVHVVDCLHWKRSLTVSCPTLERLSITCQVCETCQLTRTMTFDTPSLAYLDYCDSEYPVVNLDSLVGAKLCFARQKKLSTRRDSPKNLIKRLRNVEILELSSVETSLMFYFHCSEIPMFNNLLRLSVTTDYNLCCPSLPFLLRKSPNLQTLHLQGPLYSYYDRSRHAVKHLCVCLSRDPSYLETCPVEVLEITEYQGTKGELVHIKHFLEEMQCLELVKVCACETDDKKQLQLTNDLLKLPRLSECKIQFEFIPS